MDTLDTPSAEKEFCNSGLTISKFSKFGKALEAVPCLGRECYTAVPGAVENMLATDHLLQAGDFLSESLI